jgi:hypothetical protein
MVERAGFEPAYPKSQIYSLVPLTTRPPLHSEEPAIMQEIAVVVKRERATFNAYNKLATTVYRQATISLIAQLHRAMRSKINLLENSFISKPTQR